MSLNTSCADRAAMRLEGFLEDVVWACVAAAEGHGATSIMVVRDSRNP